MNIELLLKRVEAERKLEAQFLIAETLVTLVLVAVLCSAGFLIN